VFSAAATHNDLLLSSSENLRFLVRSARKSHVAVWREHMESHRELGNFSQKLALFFFKTWKPKHDSPWCIHQSTLDLRAGSSLAGDAKLHGVFAFFVVLFSFCAFVLL
jgi:hypothetical protein